VAREAKGRPREVRVALDRMLSQTGPTHLVEVPDTLPYRVCLLMCLPLVATIRLR
jgi:hypothetical protein